MRTLPLVLIVLVGLLGSATVLATDAAGSNQSALWAPRKLQHFVHPLVINSETAGWREASCDQLYNSVKSLLLQFGARASDLNVDTRPCESYSRVKSVDATFWVPVPADATGKRVSGPVMEAQWQTVALKGNCPFLQYVTKTVLPLFTTRNVKLIPNADCARLGIGLYAQILKPAPGPGDTPQ